jgi:hypothetical protein
MATNQYANTTPNFGSEQQWLIAFSVTNIPAASPAPISGVVYTSAAATSGGASGGQTITFDKFSGGDVMSTSVKHRPGGMGNEITYMSLPTFSDVTISKVYESQIDHQIIADLHQLVGRAMCTVTLTPLDDEGNPYLGSGSNAGSINPRTYYGRLTSVKDGGADSMSSSVRMYEIDMSVESISY